MKRLNNKSITLTTYVSSRTSLLSAAAVSTSLPLYTLPCERVHIPSSSLREEPRIKLFIGLEPQVLLLERSSGQTFCDIVDLLLVYHELKRFFIVSLCLLHAGLDDSLVHSIKQIIIGHYIPPPLLSVFLSFSTLLFICPFMRYLELRHMLHCIISVITTISN